MLDVVYLAVSAIMVGVIWVVQLVHYPTFRWIASDRMSAFSQFHSQQMSFVVAPVMVVELGTGLLLAMQGHYLLLSALGLLLFIWVITFFVSVPCHALLARAYDAATIERLIRSNWWRTAAWTLKLVILVIYYVLQL